MPRVTCRCGQVLSVPVNGPERVICPKCSARVRVRRDPPPEGDGMVRFLCLCGRRLKVRPGAPDDGPMAVKCPDCGQVVEVPTPSSSGLDPSWRANDPESPTEDLDEDDLALLDQWTSKHLGVSTSPPPPPPPPVVALPVAEPPAPPLKAEAGLRICPRCGRPLHLSAVACRNCGAPAPKR